MANVQPGPAKPQSLIDVNDFFQVPANTTSTNLPSGGGVAPLPTPAESHQQPLPQPPQSIPGPPVTLSSLTHQFPRSRSPSGTKAEQDSRLVANTYMPVPLEGTQALSPSTLQAYNPQEQQQLMHRLRAQNGLLPAPASPLNNNFVMYNSPDAGFIRNQLWRMDQLYVENELRIQQIDSELCEARSMLSRLVDHKRGCADKNKADQAKKKKQKVGNSPGVDAQAPKYIPNQTL